MQNSDRQLDSAEYQMIMQNSDRQRLCRIAGIMQNSDRQRLCRIAGIMQNSDRQETMQNTNCNGNQSSQFIRS